MGDWLRPEVAILLAALAIGILLPIGAGWLALGGIAVAAREFWVHAQRRLAA